MKLGETLAGDFLIKSLYHMAFAVPQTNQEVCEKSLTVAEVSQFISAIRKRFVYDFLLDNLPMKLFVGELADDPDLTKVYLYTHIEFLVSVNGGHVIEASATPDKPVELKEHETARVRFSYDVKWQHVSLLCVINMFVGRPNVITNVLFCIHRLIFRSIEEQRNTKILFMLAIGRFTGSVLEMLF